MSEEPITQAQPLPPPSPTGTLDTQTSANGFDYSGQIDESPNRAAPLTTSRFQGFGDALANGIMGGFNSLFITAGEEIAKRNNPNGHLSQDEWKKSEFAREGLSVPATGINTGVARFRANFFDKQKEQEARLAAMPAGWESSIVRGGGNLIGFALNPLTLAAGAVAEPLIFGKGAAWALGRIENLAIGKSVGASIAKGAARVAVNSVGGALEGVAVGLPSTGDDLVTQDLLGEHVQGMQALATLGVFAGLGGLVRGGLELGFLRAAARRRSKFGITPDQNRSVIGTAVGQLSSDKQLELEPQLKAAYNHTRMTEPEVSPEVRAKTTERVDQSFKEEEGRFNKSQDSLKRAETTFKAERPELSVAEVPLGATGILAKAADILTKEPLARTADENAFMENVPQTADMQKGMGILNKGLENVTPEDAKFLEGLTPAKEESALNSSIKKTTRDIERQPIEKLTPEERVERVESEKQLEVDKARVADLKERAEKGSPLLKRSQTTHAKRALSFVRARHAKVANDLMDKMNRESVKDVTPEEVRNTADKMNSERGDITYNQRELDSLSEQEAAIKEKGEEPERNFDKEREEVLNLDKDGELDAQDKKILESIKENKKVISRLPKILRNYGKCLLGLAS